MLLLPDKLREFYTVVFEWITGFFSGGAGTDALAWIILAWGGAVLALMLACAAARFWAYCTYRVAGAMNNSYTECGLGSDFLYNPFRRFLLFRLRWLAKRSLGSGEFWTAAEQLDALGELTRREQQVLAKALGDAYDHALTKAPASADFVESIARLRTAVDEL